MHNWDTTKWSLNRIQVVTRAGFTVCEQDLNDGLDDHQHHRKVTSWGTYFHKTVMLAVSFTVCVMIKL